MNNICVCTVKPTQDEIPTLQKSLTKHPFTLWSRVTKSQGQQQGKVPNLKILL